MLQQVHSLWFTNHVFRKKIRVVFSATAILAGSLLANITNAQSWKVIGNESQLASATTAYTSIVTVQDVGGNSIPYVVFTESGVAKVKKLSGDSWMQVGDNVAAATASYTRIVADANGKLYVSYVDGTSGSKLAVKTFDAITNTWQPLTNNSANLYVSAGSITYSSPSQFSASMRHQLAFDKDNNPYIIFAEAGSNLTPQVKKFNGTGWEQVGASPVFNERAVSVGLGIDSLTNTPYLTYMRQATSSSSTGSMVFAKFNGSAWDSIPIPAVISGGTAGATFNTRHPNIGFSKSWNPLISYFNVSNANRTTVIEYNKANATWSLIGPISTRDATGQHLARSVSGDVFGAFVDILATGSGRSVGRVMKMPFGGNSFSEMKNEEVTVGVDEPVSWFQMAIGQDSSRPFVVYCKANSSSVVTPVVSVWTLSKPVDVSDGSNPDSVVTTPRQMEYLTRALVAVRKTSSQVYLGWRMLGTDPSNIAFNVYRNGLKLNDNPITASTNYVDNAATGSVSYTVKAVLNGTEQDETATVTPWENLYKSIPINKPVGGTTPDGISYTYSANDCSVGDVDGDGVYEVFLKWDPSNSHDNSESGYTGNVFVDCYKMDGTRLWRIDLGRNIRAGAHYTQFMVYDLDGDGKAEMSCKTADATIDGAGTVIGNAAADYRNNSGYVLSGPEFLTIFNGQTGAAMATTDYYPARGSVSGWGDDYGNRVDRFVDAIAYVDGARPSLITGRGYYTRLVRVAWDWRDGKLTRRWVFDSNVTGNAEVAGQGNHQLTVGDIDQDGKDEIVNGSSAINNNGKKSYANGLGHGDAMHMSDFDPDRPGMEVVQCHEIPAQYGNYGLEFRDGKTGQPLWGLQSTEDVGRGLTADIDPRYKGAEAWGTSNGGTVDVKGNKISNSRPSVNFAIWWDGDLLRELLDGTKVEKWNWLSNNRSTLLDMSANGNALSNNTTKATPGVTADLLGDWREEIIMRDANSENLLLYTTTTPTDYRFYTLMHNSQYRVAVAWQNTAYNQPPWPDYYLGQDMTMPAQPNIYLTSAALPVKWLSFTAKENKHIVQLDWKTATETNNDYFTVERSADGQHFAALKTVKAHGNSNGTNAYQSFDEQPMTGKNFYRIRQTDKDGKSSYTQIELVNFSAEVTDEFRIFPNPAVNHVQLQLNSNSSKLQMRLMSADGKLLLQQSGSIDQINRQLNQALRGLRTGLYMVEVNDGKQQFNSKLIKQ